MAQKITALEPQKRSKDRVNVYLDDNFAFGLAINAAARLRVGDLLTDQEIEMLKAADEVEKAYDRALNYLSYRQRSETELRRYLAKRGNSEATIEEIIRRLTRAGLVDDAEFARFWVENRTKFRPRGRRGLLHELRQKGVSTEIIDAVLEDYDEDTVAWKVAKDQARRLKYLPFDKFKRRLRSRLARRGFSYELVRDILATYTSSDYNNLEGDEDG